MGEHHVLIIDDEAVPTRSLIRSLEREAPDITYLSAQNAEQGFRAISQYRPHVVILDLSLDPAIGPESGLSLIQEILSQDESIRILILTGHGSEEYGIRAVTSGAASFLSKPANVPHLLALIRDGITFSTLKRNSKDAQTNLHTSQNALGIFSRNKKMLEVIEQAAYVATTKQPVLILGETGTGKGILARAIHRVSEAREGPFIRFQPTYASHDLVASELFGHEKGAFTGAVHERKGLIAESQNGTLFIDEIDQLPTETQVLLLDVLQNKTFRRLGSDKQKTSDFRLISAMNCSVEQALNSQKFRADLYHRISHVELELPPLRDRPEDIAELADFFCSKLIEREHLHVQGLSPSAKAKLHKHSWPGNVRELEATIESGTLRAQYYQKPFVEAADISIKATGSSLPTASLSLRERVSEFELRLAQEALHLNQNNQTKAAKSLEIDRTSFRRILERAKKN